MNDTFFALLAVQDLAGNHAVGQAFGNNVTQASVVIPDKVGSTLLAFDFGTWDEDSTYWNVVMFFEKSIHLPDFHCKDFQLQVRKTLSAFFPFLLSFLLPTRLFFGCLQSNLLSLCFHTLIAQSYFPPFFYHI